MHDHVYPVSTPELAQHRRELAPEIDRAFHDFSKVAFAEGALPRKVKQLIAVAVAHTTARTVSAATRLGGRPKPASRGRLKTGQRS